MRLCTPPPPSPPPPPVVASARSLRGTPSSRGGEEGVVPAVPYHSLRIPISAALIMFPRLRLPPPRRRRSPPLPRPSPSPGVRLGKRDTRGRRCAPRTSFTMSLYREPSGGSPSGDTPPAPMFVPWSSFDDLYYFAWRSID